MLTKLFWLTDEHFHSCFHKLVFRKPAYWQMPCASAPGIYAVIYNRRKFVLLLHRT